MTIDTTNGTRDNYSADHDEPYNYLAPAESHTFPFTVRQYARLLVLRSRVQANLIPDEVAVA